ncbi:glycosyltransferase-like domain-containing protein 1-like [Corticium candelabrum]|uniref:glycosyltransferase-like domain-containing protein 1-like n=1 Tax=Corticium candelabrum TaxID=121492 RepID=UPI002E26B791|nr:glycosyltransferase-like domain-containing protein 1-like [Corticium candelabrum]
MYSKQDMAASAHKVVLLIEPFCGGSHEKLMKLLIESIPGCELLAMSDKKWHWRMRTSALYFARVIPQDHCYRHPKLEGLTSLNFNNYHGYKRNMMTLPIRLFGR